MFGRFTRSYFFFLFMFLLFSISCADSVRVFSFSRYQPNEVKHRKRTTRPQLKVLEDVYKYDTKPNASLRKKLAEELGMTPRGVQVCFFLFLLRRQL